MAPLPYRLRDYGIAQRFDPEKSRPEETTTITCQHCNKVFKVKPMCDPADVGGLCKVCDQLICAECVGKGCTPLLKRIEQQEARGRFLKSVMEN